MEAGLHASGRGGVCVLKGAVWARTKECFPKRMHLIHQRRRYAVRRQKKCA
jgi:hypothetical protein